MSITRVFTPILTDSKQNIYKYFMLKVEGVEKFHKGDRASIEQVLGKPKDALTAADFGRHGLSRTEAAVFAAFEVSPDGETLIYPLPRHIIEATYPDSDPALLTKKEAISRVSNVPPKITSFLLGNSNASLMVRKWFEDHPFRPRAAPEELLQVGLRRAPREIYERLGVEPPPKASWHEYVTALFPNEKGREQETEGDSGSAGENALAKVDEWLLQERIRRGDLNSEEFTALQLMLHLEDDKSSLAYPRIEDAVGYQYSSKLSSISAGPVREKYLSDRKRDFVSALAGSVSKVRKALLEDDMPYPQIRLLLNWFTVEYESYCTTPNDIPELAKRIAPLREFTKRQHLAAS